MNKYSSDEIELYITNTYEVNEMHSAEKHVLSCGNRTTLFAVIYVLLFNIGTSVDGRYSMTIANMLVLLLTPIIIPIAVLITKSSIRRHLCKNKKAKSHPLVATLGVLGGVLGIGLARAFFPTASEASAEIAINILVVSAYAVLTLMGCMHYYQVYLIRKYCSHLKNKI